MGGGRGLGVVGGGHRRRLICRFKVVWWWPIERRAVSIRFGYRTCFFFVFSFVIESIHGRRIRVDFRASISNGFAKKKKRTKIKCRDVSLSVSRISFFFIFFCRGGGDFISSSRFFFRLCSWLRYENTFSFRVNGRTRRVVGPSG